jgi:hypothetical protein
MSVKRKLPTWAQLIALIKPKDINYYSPAALCVFARTAAIMINNRLATQDPNVTSISKMKAEMLGVMRIDSHWSHANAVKLRMLREQTILRPVLLARGPIQNNQDNLAYYGLQEDNLKRYYADGWGITSYNTTGHPHSSASTNRARLLDWKNVAHVINSNKKRYYRADYTRGLFDNYYMTYLTCLVNPHSLFVINSRLALSCGNNRNTPILMNGRYIVAMAFKHSKKFIKSIPRFGYDTMTRENRDRAIKDIKRVPAYRFFRNNYTNFNLLHFGIESGLYPDLTNQIARDMLPYAPLSASLYIAKNAFDSCTQGPGGRPGSSSLACFVRK